VEQLSIDEKTRNHPLGAKMPEIIAAHVEAKDYGNVLLLSITQMLDGKRQHHVYKLSAEAARMLHDDLESKSVSSAVAQPAKSPARSGAPVPTSRR